MIVLATPACVANGLLCSTEINRLSGQESPRSNRGQRKINTFAKSFAGNPTRIQFNAHIDSLLAKGQTTTKFENIKREKKTKSSGPIGGDNLKRKKHKKIF